MLSDNIHASHWPSAELTTKSTKFGRFSEEQEVEKTDEAAEGGRNEWARRFGCGLQSTSMLSPIISFFTPNFLRQVAPNSLPSSFAQMFIPNQKAFECPSDDMTDTNCTVKGYEDR